MIADGAISETKLTPQLAAKVNAGGPAGAQGPAGPQGAQGPAGPAGAVPSTFAKTLLAFVDDPITTGSVPEIIVTSTPVTIVGIDGEGDITVGTNKRIIGSGYVDVQNTDTDPSNSSTASCALAAIGRDPVNQSTRFFAILDPVTIPANTSVRIPLSGGTNPIADDYRIDIQCQATGPGPATATGGALNASVSDR